MTDGPYLDNAASVPPFDWALDCFTKSARDFPGNQEAAGHAGVRAAAAVKEASRRLSSALAPGYEVLWCGTGTDALAAAVQAHCMANPGTEIVTTEAEHPALRQAVLRFADRYGLTVRNAEVAGNGQIRPESVSTLLGPRTSLLAIHHVNAETGAVQDLVSLRNLLDQRAPGALFLADTIQSVCKVAVPMREAHPDLLTLSGCKIGAPCGAALLWRDHPERPLTRTLHALRERHHAIGRCVPAAAITISHVVETLLPALKERGERAAAFRASIRASFPSTLRIQETIPEELSSPYIFHLLLPGFQGGVLVRILGSEGISVAAGSACAAETRTPSETLTAMGYGRNLAFSALRLSFWDTTTEQEIEQFKKVFNQSLKNY